MRLSLVLLVVLAHLFTATAQWGRATALVRLSVETRPEDRENIMSNTGRIMELVP